MVQIDETTLEITTLEIKTIIAQLERINTVVDFKKERDSVGLWTNQSILDWDITLSRVEVLRNRYLYYPINMVKYDNIGVEFTASLPILVTTKSIYPENAKISLSKVKETLTISGIIDTEDNELHIHNSEVHIE